MSETDTYRREDPEQPTTPACNEQPEQQEGTEGTDFPNGTEHQEPSESAGLPEEQEPVSNTEKLMRSLAGDDDEYDETAAATFRQMLDAAPRWFLGQWKMLLICLFGLFLYITNGYQAQLEMMEEKELETQLKDWRYRSILRTSKLTDICRQSQLEERLREQGDTALHSSKMPPFTIRVKE